MNNGQMELNGKLQSDTHKPPILVTDMVRYLSGLAKLHDSEKLGDSELSTGLRLVADALRPYAKHPVHELANALKEAKLVNRPKASSRKPKMMLPPNLEFIHQQDVEKILADENYTKGQIAELGFQRFGISKSMLQRLRKEDAKRSVRSALENERTLDVISQQARKAGKARAS